MSIQLLDRNTIDMIAAGEVIDRPASVVKELVENAIDAGADKITVEIKDGGISLIRITDNGSGIDAGEAGIAFLRHSTSKIKDAGDLTTIKSLGFRGEALSSIAAVSMVELMTKTRESFSGIRYVIEGGVEKEVQEIGIPDGTTFVVRNLFYNTPARRKFLKSAQTETGYISDILEKIALSHPEISIRFLAGGLSRLHTSGNNKLKDAIYGIFGRETANNLIEIDVGTQNMRIEGYIGKPALSRGNRNYENYFINGRYIKSTVINKAIEEAYKPYIMLHRYPFTALSITVEPETVDVNVHPAKMEIRFKEAETIYRFIADAVSEALSRKELIPEIVTKEEPVKEMQSVTPLNSESTPSTERTRSPERVRPPEPFEVKRNAEYENLEKHDNITKYDNILSSQETLFKEELLTNNARSRHVLIGQIFKTYWLVEFNDELYIIDQHAAHEKVLYEKTMKRFKEKTVISQTVNPPIVLNLNLREAGFVDNHVESFKALGYEIEHFGGNDYCVRAIPHDLLNIDKAELLMEIIDDTIDNPEGLSGTSINRLSHEMITDRIATMSCKAAVKGNNAMSFREADSLIDELLTLENPYNCPHGRPTIISMSKYEIEKRFKRIV